MLAEEKKVVEIDHDHLRQVLRNLTRELSTPFLERRSRSKSHKTSPMEELSDAIQELSERERELQAAAGIASLLIDNNESLQATCDSEALRIAEKKDKIRSLKEELQSVKNNLDQKSLQLEEESMLLLHSEHTIESLKSQISQLSIKNDSFCDEEETYKEKIELKCSQFETMNSSLKASINNVKQKLNEEINAKREAQKALEDCQNALEGLKNENEKLANNNRDLRDQNQRISAKRYELEENIESLTSLNEEYKENLFRLERKLKNFDCVRESFNDKFQKLRSSMSLDEVPDFEMDSLSTELCGFGEITLRDAPKFFDKQTSVMVTPTYYRKSPSEEYFQLTSQAVKINSVYMDKICTMPTKQLYEQAMKDEIPFHTWYFWIEKQLNQAYIQNLYKNQLKSSKDKQKVIPDIL